MCRPSCARAVSRSALQWAIYQQLHSTDVEVDALGVITISRGCFERCGSNKKTPP